MSAQNKLLPSHCMPWNCLQEILTSRHKKGYVAQEGTILLLLDII